MPSRRSGSPDTPLCRLTFKDGRHCNLPAHPAYDGLCYSHGTFARRASRQDNLLHALEPLANGRSSRKARARALKAVARAMDAGRLSPERVRVLARISSLIDQTSRFADEQSFTSQSGPAWDGLRKAVDDLDAYRDRDKKKP